MTVVLTDRFIGDYILCALGLVLIPFVLVADLILWRKEFSLLDLLIVARNYSVLTVARAWVKIERKWRPVSSSD